MADRRMPTLFFFRVLADGEEWLCKRGRAVVGRFGSPSEAVAFAKAAAAANPPSGVLFHDRHGSVTTIAVFDDPAVADADESAG